MITPEFPVPDTVKIVEKIRSILIFGKPLTTKRNLACVLCGRSTLPLGRLAWYGAPLCSRSDCEMIQLSQLTELFPSPYGCALTARACRVFCKTIEKTTVLIQRNPVIDRAEHLATGYARLLEWQRTFHDYERSTNPAYQLGAITLIPPRHLEEVMVFRAMDLPTWLDPTKHLPSELARQLHQVREHGPSALTVPF